MYNSAFSAFVSCLILGMNFTAAIAADNVLTQIDSDGTLHLSMDGGYEWTTLNEYLGVAPQPKLSFFVDHTAGLFYSTDGGYEWDRVNNAPEPDVEASAVSIATYTESISPYRPPLILSIDRDGNAWLSFDGGYEWISEAEFERQSIDNDSVQDVVGAVSQDGRILQFRPHPLHGNAAAILNLQERAQVKLTLYDLQGRKAAVLADGMLSAGEHNLPIDASLLEHGVYSYSLQIDQTVERGSISVAR